MTAEIAILNKTAVSLAADSAVSIGQYPNLKIYNTVNKIFELSCRYPVGIMIYGRLDYMGLPLETVIKEYRRLRKGRSFDRISDYKNDFLNYLNSEVPRSIKDEEDNIHLLIYDLYSRAAKDIEELILKDILTRGSFHKSKTNGFAQTYIKGEIDRLKKLSFIGTRKSTRLPSSYIAIIDGLADALMAKIAPNEETKRLLRSYAGLFLNKNEFSSYRTGIVFAGFGDRDICPSLEAVQIDGIVNGALKNSTTNSVDIGRQPPQADILGFAQDDMMKSFLDGVDPRFRNYINGLVSDIITDTCREILNATITDPVKASSAMSRLDSVIQSMTKSYTTKIDKFIDKNSSLPIKEMIRSMPRQEMATLAESLIEITSLKRKVTRQQETVGGEVDVAIISKSEGFVWVKRKHYFPSELNQRFFTRREEAEQEGRHATARK
ncbi:hypothetical protein [Methylorubrum sp. SB2]|uniref:hypothetical protein n=1 Tax=Methylorubrum subtropicum TaxID=3138812 RepID=UPI00313C5237